MKRRQQIKSIILTSILMFCIVFVSGCTDKPSQPVSTMESGDQTISVTPNDTVTEETSDSPDKRESNEVETSKAQETSLDNDFEPLEIESEYVVELEDEGLDGAISD